MQLKEISKLNRFYGHSKVIKDYCGYPKDKPLPILIEHGLNNLYKLDDEHFNECLFDYWVWNEDVKEFNLNLYKLSPKSVHTLGSPFIYLADEKLPSFESDDARGTIAFPSHLNPNRPVDEWYDEYAQLLKGLPEEFQPITVSLHPYDISKGLHQVFEKHGLTTVTCSPLVLERYQEIKENPGSFWRYYNYGGPHYLNNFIKYCKGKKYATSNKIAAASYYAAYLGLRFFIYHGNQPTHLLRQEQNFTAEENEEYRKMKSFFSKENLENALNSDIQKELAREKLGVKHKLGKKELNELLERLYKSRKYVGKQQEQQDELERTKAELARTKKELEKRQEREIISAGKIEVLDVIKTQQLPELLLGYAIDNPSKGFHDGGGVKVSGWVLGRKSAVVDLELVSGGKVIYKTAVNNSRLDVARRYPGIVYADRCGFSTVVSLMGHPDERELILEAVLSDRSRAPVGVVRFKRDSLTVDYASAGSVEIQEKLKKSNSQLQAIKQKLQVD